MILCLIGFLTGCGTTTETVITEYETREIFRDKYVEVKRELTEPVEIVSPARPNTDTIDLKVALQLQQTEARTCNGQLAAIASISGTDAE